jgi:hypothetical protein
MKRSEELKQLLRQRPFRPFRIHLNNSKALEVVCPEINLIGEDMAIIGITDPKNPDPYSDDFELVLMNEIARVETDGAANEAAADSPLYR